MEEGSGGVGWRGPHTETDGYSWAATGSRQRRRRTVFLDPAPSQAASSPLPHQHTRRGSLGPHFHLGAHTYHLAEKGSALGLTILLRLCIEGKRGYSERKLDATTRRGLERGWSRTEA